MGNGYAIFVKVKMVWTINAWSSSISRCKAISSWVFAYIATTLFRWLSHAQPPLRLMLPINITIKGFNSLENIFLEIYFAPESPPLPAPALYISRGQSTTQNGNMAEFRYILPIFSLTSRLPENQYYIPFRIIFLLFARILIILAQTSH